MTPPDAQDPNELGDDLTEAERELLPDGDQAPSAGEIPSAEVDGDNVPHPPAEDIG
jgi:hypothetical protein